MIYCSKKCGLSLLPRSCPQKYSIFNSKSASKIFEVEDRLWTQEPAAQIDSTFTEFVANLQVCLKRSYVVNCQFFTTYTNQFCWGDGWLILLIMTYTIQPWYNSRHFLLAQSKVPFIWGKVVLPPTRIRWKRARKLKSATFQKRVL